MPKLALVRTVESVVTKVYRHGREVLDGIIQRGAVATRPNPRVKDTGPPLPQRQAVVPTPGASFHYTAPKGWVKYFSSAPSGNLATAMRRLALQQCGKNPSLATGLLGRGWGGARRIPFYALVGFTMTATGKNFSTFDENGFKNICGEIRDLFEPLDKTIQRDSCTPEGADVPSDVALADFDFGPLIAKGCSAAVYSARLKSIVAEPDTVEDGDVAWSLQTESDITVISRESSKGTTGSDVIMETGSDISLETGSDISMETGSDISILDDFESDISVIGSEQDSDCESYTESDQPVHRSDYNYAIKMMFNYGAESNAGAIWRAMEREVVPSKMADTNSQMDTWQNGNRVRKKRLKPHPNVIDMLSIFFDDVPALSDSMTQYPFALPERLNPDGLGRNKTLFLVMKRYDCTLREFLSDYTPPVDEALVIFAQLVEAVVHLNNHQVAHRDIKSDNVLLLDATQWCHLPMSERAQWPHLVLTDFGCCLAEEGMDTMRVPFFSNDVDRGGNTSLMAPEISSACPGCRVYLDYRKSDLWAVGTLAYEIFDRENPFYDTDAKGLDSRMYQDGDLPNLSGNVPSCLRNLISQMLRRNPEQRPDARTVADCLQVLLWAPPEWYKSLTLGGTPPSPLEVARWLLSLAATTLCQSLGSSSHSRSVELDLKQLFLSRVDFDRAMQTVRFLWTLAC